jgi:hypothetical protein
VVQVEKLQLTALHRISPRKYKTMRKIKLAAASGVALLALGGTAAVAETSANDTQAVTITVTASAREITTSGTASLSTVAGANPFTDQVSGGSIAFTNINEQAKITVNLTRVSVAGGELETATQQRMLDTFGQQTDLRVRVNKRQVGGGLVTDTATWSDALFVARNNNTAFSAQTVIADIPANENVANVQVLYNFQGQNPTTLGETVAEFIFTIEDNN